MNEEQRNPQNDPAISGNIGIPITAELIGRFKEQGFTDDEIGIIVQHLNSCPTVDNTATVVFLCGDIQLVCRTIGLAIRAARPEAYLGTMEEAVGKRLPR